MYTHAHVHVHGDVHVQLYMYTHVHVRIITLDPPDRRIASMEQGFVSDAFRTLDEVLKRTQSPSGSRVEQQMIQRWLLVFARQHLSEVCEKLMEALTVYGASQHAGQRLRLPHAADEPESVAEQRDDSSEFFLLDTLRRVLDVGAESGRLGSLRVKLLPFCFERLDLVHSPAVRHAAALCVGSLSRTQLKEAVELFAGRLQSLSRSGWSDREQREYVAYRAPRWAPNSRQLNLARLHPARRASLSLHPTCCCAALSPPQSAPPHSWRCARSQPTKQPPQPTTCPSWRAQWLRRRAACCVRRSPLPCVRTDTGRSLAQHALACRATAALRHAMPRHATPCHTTPKFTPA